MADKTTTPGRRSWKVSAARAVLAIVLLIVAALGIVRTVTVPSTGAVDMRGNQVRADEIPTGRVSASATPSGVGRLVVPSVGLNVPLGSLEVVDNTIEPPGFTSAYWVRTLGVSPADARHGTVFIALHSLRNGGVGPGNFLINVKQRKAAVAFGAKIRVDNVTYRVTRTMAIGKARIDQDVSVWENTPNRLVVITCLQRPEGGPSVSNVVIEATRV